MEKNILKNLSKVKSPISNKAMYIAQELAGVLKHTNSRQAIKDAKLDSQDFIVVSKSEHREFFLQLINKRLVGGRASKITLLTEKGVYKVLFNTKKQESKEYKKSIINTIENGNFRNYRASRMF